MLTTYAFPTVFEGNQPRDAFEKEHSQGMTLRDWFAGQIIAAPLGSDASNGIQRDKNGQLCEFDPARLSNLAKNAYQAADALVNARSAIEKAR